jgi:hypothetical protein
VPGDAHAKIQSGDLEAAQADVDQAKKIEQGKAVFE